MLMKELALSAPMNKGFFPSVIATEMEEFVHDGKRYKRPGLGYLILQFQIESFYADARFRPIISWT